MSMITVTPIIVPPRAPVHQLRAAVVPEPSWKNNKRPREDDNDPFGDSKRPRTCPPLADAIAYFTTGEWPTEESSPDSPSSSSDTASHSEDKSSLETSGEYIENSVTEDVSGSSSLPTGQADANWVENFKFASDDDLLAWVRSLPDMGDETTEGGSSPTTSDTPASSSALPQPPPMPICAVDQEIPLHYIPPPAEYRYAVRGRRVRDTEDLRKNIVNSLRWQRYYATEPCTFLPAYERDLPDLGERKLPGTPPRNTHDRAKLDPPASVYKYTLDSDDNATSLSTRQRGTCPGDDKNKNTSGYSASELFGPDADTVKVARCEPIRPRAPVDFCELTTLEHKLRLRADDAEATKPSARATVKVRADPRAVEFWKASVNEFVEAAQSAKLDEDTARLEAELKAFFEEAADHDDDEDLEAVEIPDAESEVGADVSFESEYAPTTVSESSSEESEDGEGVFDYEQWVADCQW